MGITKQELIEEPNEQTREMYSEFNLILEEVIQKGLDLMVSLSESKVSGWEKNQKQIMVSLLKEILEKIDGITILSDKYSQQNISVLARSALEGFLDLNFMLKKPKRALAYVYCKSLDYLSKHDEIKKIEIKEDLKSLQEELGEELKKQRRKQFKNKKWFKEHQLNWRRFYFNPNKDKKYKTGGAKIHYSFLCAETHNQNSLIHSYSDEGSFILKDFRVNDKTEIGLISQMVVVFSGEVFERIIKLYIDKNSSDLEQLKKWRIETLERTEKLIVLDSERLKNIQRIKIKV